MSPIATRFAEKLHKQMLVKGMNQQRLAKTAGVSDSEVSRVLSGKSHPGLENAFRLARAVGLSLDYLADDEREEDPGMTGSDSEQRGLEALVRLIGPFHALQILHTVHVLGYDLAIRRLWSAERPLLEVGDAPRNAPGPARPGT